MSKGFNGSIGQGGSAAVKRNSVTTGGGVHQKCNAESEAGRISGVPSSSKSAATAGNKHVIRPKRPTTRGAGRDLPNGMETFKKEMRPPSKLGKLNING
jgi:hypothetical protein